MKKNNNKGFTLMEMLIVVAIIAVLVAIAIPVFTNQLEKAREATDMANIRSAYAEVMACALTGDNGTQNNVNHSETDGVSTWTKHVAAVQKVKGWINAPEKIGGVENVTANSLDGWNITFTEGAANAKIEEGKAPANNG